MQDGKPERHVNAKTGQDGGEAPELLMLVDAMRVHVDKSQQPTNLEVS